ncbi:MAG: hotdog fold thioesterase [Gammaproteobacteria bacterium]
MIWFKPITAENFNEREKDTLAHFMGIKFTEVTENTLTAIMPVQTKIKQPIGIVHGGANVVLAETLASNAANAVIDIENYYCVGLEINANHIRSVREGTITGVTRPFHIGRSTQVWHVELFNDKGQLTCISRMTASVLKRTL